MTTDAIITPSLKSKARSPDTILIVEDDEGLNRLIAKHLNREGFRTDSVFTGKEAVSKSAANRDMIMLLDYKLPDMTGIMVLESLDKAGIVLPFVVMTGYGDEELAVEMMKRDAIDYIVKTERFIDLLPEKMKRASREVENKRRLSEAQEALKASEALYRTIMDTSPDEIIITDLEGRIIKISQRTIEIHGFDKKEDFIGKSALDLIAPADHVRAKKNMQKTLEQGIVKNAEYTFLKKNGTTFPGELNASVLKGGDGKPLGFIQVTRDITQKKKSEAKINHLNMVLHSIRRVNGLIVREKNRNSLIQKGCKLLTEARGYTSAWIVLFDEKGKPAISASSGLDQEFLKLKGMLAAGELVECWKRAMERQGAVLIHNPESQCKECPVLGMEQEQRALTVRLEHENKIFGLLSILVQKDLAEGREELNLLEEVADDLAYALYGIEVEKQQIKSMEKVQENEERFRQFFENEPAYCYMVSPDGIVIDVNNSALEVLGYTKDELVGKSLKMIYAAESQARVKQLFAIWKKTGRLTNEEAVIITKRGERRTVLLNADVVKDKNGNVVHSIFVQNDITERKKAEEQINVSLKEKEVLLLEVHHRVKNNMQVISSLFNLQSRQIKDKRSLEIFKSMQSRVRSIALIHERLYQAKNYARVNFAEYVRSMTKHLFSVYGIDQNRINLNLNIKDVFLDINAAIPCGLIINELTTNAIKHAFPNREKGEIKIDMHPIDSKEVELTIADDGVGMAKSVDLKSIESLGLHLVSLLAESQLQGEIKLDRKKGTCFRIRLKVKQ